MRKVRPALPPGIPNYFRTFRTTAPSTDHGREIISEPGGDWKGKETKHAYLGGARRGMKDSMRAAVGILSLHANS